MFGCGNATLKILGAGILSLGLATMAFGRVGPVSQYGQLQAGKNSSNQGRIYGSCPAYSTSGNEVQVRGMSLYWSSAESASTDFYTADAIKKMVSDMNIELIRIPMGVSNSWDNGRGYLTGGESRQKNFIQTVVNAAIDQDIYVIIDWHTEEANNQTTSAVNFFSEMAKTYGSYDNVIFEIFNEPTTQSWSTIKTYADQVVAAIRTYSDNLIVVGNRNWDQYPNEAISNPVTDSKNNTAYTFHYYACSHTTGSEGSHAITAMNNGLSVFVTEWGTGNADGSGDYSNCTSANAEWQTWLNNNKLSWANWSASKISEGTAAFTSNSSATYFNYTTSGSKVKEYLSSNPTSYTACSGIAVSSSSVASSSSSSLPAGYTDYIDDFEDGDSLAYTGGIWYAYTDEESGASSTIGNTTNSDGYNVIYSGSATGNSSKYVAGITGITLNQGSYKYDPFVALGLKLNADESAYDLSSCNTISYKYKGAAHNFKAEDMSVTDYGYHQVTKAATTSWTSVSIAWNTLSQDDWAKSVELSKSNINKFTWEIKGTQPSPNYLYIDDVRCNGIAIKPVVASSSSSAKSSSSSAVSSSSVKSSSSSAVSSSSVKSSSSSAVSSSSVKSSSSSAVSSSSVKSSSSSAVSSSSVKSSSSESMFVITGDLEQTVVRGNDFSTVTITGVTSFNRVSYNAYYLTFNNSNGTLSIVGTVPDYATEGSVQENFTVNGTQLTVSLNVVSASSSSSAASSSSNALESSSSVIPSSSSEAIASSSSETILSSSSDGDLTGIIAGTAPVMNMTYADNTLTVSFANAASIKVQVFDMMGHLVTSTRESVAGYCSMNLDNLNRGKYLVRVTSGSLVRTTRVTVR